MNYPCIVMRPWLTMYHTIFISNTVVVSIQCTSCSMQYANVVAGGDQNIIYEI